MYIDTCMGCNAFVIPERMYGTWPICIIVEINTVAPVGQCSMFVPRVSRGRTFSLLYFRRGDKFYE